MQQILNKQEQTAAARERLSIHVPVATNTHATEERWSLQRCYKQATRLELSQCSVLVSVGVKLPLVSCKEGRQLGGNRHSEGILARKHRNSQC
jgi:hypothetical protein